MSLAFGRTGGSTSHHDPEEEEEEEDEEDSVMYFIRRVLRGDPLGKFIYLVMRPREITEPYNPYDLRVVTHKETDHANYFTMAKEGVTHVHGGEADFIPLGEWLRECEIFNAARQIPFFQKYRRFKTFYFWRKYVPRTTVAGYKDLLEENLFFLNKDLSMPLLRIRAICMHLVSLAMFAPFQETKTLEHYIDHQTRNREVTARRLDHKIREMRDIIDSACKQAMATSAPRPVLPKDKDAAQADSPGRGRQRGRSAGAGSGPSPRSGDGDEKHEKQSYS
eukprot:gene4714-20990_t